MRAANPEEFVCEPLVPVRGTAQTAAMARGEPGLPDAFTWRGTRYRLLGVIESWKTSGPCRSGADEIYLRRHWYRILTEPRAILTVYFERQPRNRKRLKARWWVYSFRHRSENGRTAGPGPADGRT